jgi:hypothetical protein
VKLTAFRLSNGPEDSGREVPRVKTKKKKKKSELAAETIVWLEARS